MTAFQRATIAGIDSITVMPKSAKKTVVMLHGFGANFEDLAPLHSYLDPTGAFHWIFPNGILEVPIGPHMMGRAWFPIRMAEIEAAAIRGEVLDMADALPDGMKVAEERVLELVSALRIKPEDLVLGGFSQGAMMAIQAAIHTASPLAGMILFSGTLINQNEWKTFLPRQAKTPFVQSHGRMDQILGYKHAERLHETLLNAGLKGDFLGFEGYHEIPLPVIRKASEFLSSVK